MRAARGVLGNARMGERANSAHSRASRNPEQLLRSLGALASRFRGDERIENILVAACFDDLVGEQLRIGEVHLVAAGHLHETIEP